MILDKGESTGTVDEVKDLISNEEPEKFENEVQDENEGEFHLLFVNRISLKSCLLYTSPSPRDRG